MPILPIRAPAGGPSAVWRNHRLQYENEEISARSRQSLQHAGRPRFRFEIDTEPVYRNKPIRTGADGIALSADRGTLFYCQVTGRNLYAVDTRLLRNFDVPDSIIRDSVQTLGKGTTTDGMHADNQGRVFYTMLEGKGIGYYSPYTQQAAVRRQNAVGRRGSF